MGGIPTRQNLGSNPGCRIKGSMTERECDSLLNCGQPKGCNGSIPFAPVNIKILGSLHRAAPVSDLKSAGGRDAMGIDTSVTRKCSCTPIGREV